MEKYLLKVLSDKDNPILLPLLNGLEEQGIFFTIISLEAEFNTNLNKAPFNLIVIVKGTHIYLKSRDFNKTFNINLSKDFNYKSKLENNTKKEIKLLGLDIGRYIKGTPLKGDWNE